MWARVRAGRTLASPSQAPYRFFAGASMLGLRGPRLPPAGILLLLPFVLLLPPRAAPAPHRASYKPVIVVHGLFDSSYSFRRLLEYINEVWPQARTCLWGAGGVDSGWGGRTRNRKPPLWVDSLPWELVLVWGELGEGREPRF